MADVGNGGGGQGGEEGKWYGFIKTYFVKVCLGLKGRKNHQYKTTVSFITPIQNSKSKAKELCLKETSKECLPSFHFTTDSLRGAAWERQIPRGGSNPECLPGAKGSQGGGRGRGAAPAKESQARSLFKRRSKRETSLKWHMQEITELGQTSEARKTRPREDRPLRQ